MANPKTNTHHNIFLVTELRSQVTTLKDKIDLYETRMLTKQEVAARAGMTVSWLDNSQSAKAIKIRNIAVRYGLSHSSPVRYPLSKIAALCLENECITR